MDLVMGDENKGWIYIGNYLAAMDVERLIKENI